MTKLPNRPSCLFAKTKLNKTKTTEGKEKGPVRKMSK